MADAAAELHGGQPFSLQVAYALAGPFLTQPNSLGMGGATVVIDNGGWNGLYTIATLPEGQTLTLPARG
jgi:hypothetical protein